MNSLSSELKNLGPWEKVENFLLEKKLLFGEYLHLIFYKGERSRV